MATVVTNDNFASEVLEFDGPVLVDFFAPWCGPCQALGPILDELNSDLPAGSKVVKVNIDDAPELAAEYSVVSIPTIKVFKGGEIVQEFMGVQDKSVLKDALEANA